MPRPRKPDPIVGATDKVAAALAGFDYEVNPEDFVLYELDRLIEEERASFEDPEFRSLIDEGLRAHIAERPEVRARLAGILRGTSFTGDSRTIALRVAHALEDLNADLCNVAILVRNYTAYLLSRLETLEQDSIDERITTAADLLFESTGDRTAAETALDVLCNTPSPISARVLAHAVSEPLLDEDLETRALSALKTFWPLSRHYMLYNLLGHAHEDVPVRWFQLFVSCDELTAVELVLEEVRAHADNARHQEDLTMLMEILRDCRDPELEDKILDAINSPSTNTAAVPFLRKFLEGYRGAPPTGPTPWSGRAQALELNRQYVAAAELYDRGKRAEAAKALQLILATEPDYPFALMLKRVLHEDGL